MPAAISPVQMEALRALREGAPPTFSRLAAAANINSTTIRERSRRDNWKTRRFTRSGKEVGSGAPEGEADAEALSDVPEGMSLEDVRKRLAAALQQLLVRVVELAERGVVDKGRIDAMLSMGRILEQAEAAGSADQQRRSDDELAAMLERIDERIIELAQAYAERLGGAEHRDGMG